ncbi:GDP-mannose 4,6-dehydratase [Polyangium sp. 6x1]|uniref:GDP-mannose 4,6-dehydratase n=1 Tax=Polyangium sp. 6x1 TaxID=3042689 RepID=UPI002482C184|nr:GDP-mannose 4,6-dehydratase [Polyangium sp. 6x1]MDI1449211.1 GDP-mannose 4,6-dehydratase [Polyangium sp. 6x1]
MEASSFYAGKRVVVTGAGGFIGSHLVEALVREGANVRALVRYTSSSQRGHLDRVPATALANVEVVLGNVEDAACVRKLVRGADVVFHLAALIGIPYSYVAPHQYVATNVSGTLNVLEAVREHGARMVHTSTSETYGSARYAPIDEAHPLTGQSPYSATKIAADKLAESYFLSFGTPVATIRPFNTYGPRQSSRAFIPSVMKQLAAGRDVVRVGSTRPKRDLNFVEDTVAGFLAVGASDRALGQVINVGSGRTISMGELAELIFTISGKPARLETDETRVRPDASEVELLLADGRKAKELVGYEPRVTLEEGLQKTWAYVLERIADYRPDEYAI